MKGGVKKYFFCKAAICAGLLIVFTTFPLAVNANSKYASLVINADTGVVLHQENAGAYRHPASLTKIMTLYLTFDAIEKGKLRMSQRLRVSSRAEAQPPSRLGLRRGERISVRDAILSVVVKSANDSAVVLAEAIAGTEWQFTSHMNRMAKQLGMNHSTFKNASGLHHRRQRTTAYDMARLAVAIRRDFPRYYHLFSRTRFFFKGKTYKTHNRVMNKYRGADGLKTGYIRASGFNLITSAERRGDKIIGVVMGGRTSRSRDQHMMKLLDRAFYVVNKRSGNTKKASYKKRTPKPMLRPQLTRTLKTAALRSQHESAPQPTLKNKPVYVEVQSSAKVNNSEAATLKAIEIDTNKYEAQYGKKRINGRKVPLPQFKPGTKINYVNTPVADGTPLNIEDLLQHTVENINR